MDEGANYLSAIAAAPIQNYESAEKVQTRFWMVRDFPAPTRIVKTLYPVTRRWVNYIELAPVSRTVTLTIPAGATVSNSVDLTPQFTITDARQDLEVARETVQTDPLLPVEIAVSRYAPNPAYIGNTTPGFEVPMKMNQERKRTVGATIAVNNDDDNWNAEPDFLEPGAAQ